MSETNAQDQHNLNVQVELLRSQLNKEPRHTLIQQYIAMVDECVKWQSLAQFYKESLEKLTKKEVKEVSNV